MSVLETLRCTPTRRSIKFVAGPHARHFLIFDGAIDKESRLLLFAHIFAFARALVDAAVLPRYDVATYLPEELVEVRVVADVRHPAYGQAGLYARRAIPTGTLVTPYAGFIEIFSASCSSRTYTMGFGAVNDDVALDAEFAGNYGRFANDPRGVDGGSANLSAESRINARGESFTALIARRQIAEGEEILMAYGKAHSLSPTPWVSMRGRPLLRARRAGELPLPCVSPPRTHDVAASEAATAADAASSELLWECTQCGAWSATRRVAAVDANNVATATAAATATMLDCCVYCNTPRLHGARLVHVLSAPPLSPTRLRREAGPRREALDVAGCGDRIYSTATAATTAACVKREREHDDEDDEAVAHNSTPHHGKDNNSVGDEANKAPIHNNNTQSPPLTAAAASSSSRRVTLAPRRRRNWEDNLQLAPSSASTVGCVVTSYKLDLLRATPTTTTTTTTAAAVFAGSNGSSSSGSCGAAASTLSSSSSSSSLSVRIDWPLHVPFLPWQVWDPAVPYAAFAKHSRFETHEHVFLYHVQSPSSPRHAHAMYTRHDATHDNSGDDDKEASDSHSEDNGNEDAQDSHDSDSNNDDDDGCGDDDAKENKRDDGDNVERAAGNAHAQSSQQQQQRPGRRARLRDTTHRRPCHGRGHVSRQALPRRRTRSGGLWERQDCHEELLERPHATVGVDNNNNSGGGCDGGCHAVDGVDGSCAYSCRCFCCCCCSQRDGHCSHVHLGATAAAAASRATGGAAAAHRPTHHHHHTRSDGAHDDVAVCASELLPLARVLAGSHEVDRLVVLPRLHNSNNSSNNSSSSNNTTTAMSELLVEAVRRALARMTRRVFAVKSFQAGDVVAYVGGVVRRRNDDTRCRPDASPLALPMVLLAPAAWRRRLRRWRLQQTPRNVAASSSTACRHNKVDVVVADTKDDDKRTHGDDDEDDEDDDEAAAALLLHDNACDFVRRLAALELVVTNEMMYCPCLVLPYDDDDDAAAVEQQQQQQQLLAQACNVALVLTMDALGSPHVVAVATRPIAAFEALLARAQ